MDEQLAGAAVVIAVVITANCWACPAVAYPRPYFDSLFRNVISNAIKYRAHNLAYKEVFH